MCLERGFIFCVNGLGQGGVGTVKGKIMGVSVLDRGRV